MQDAKFTDHEINWLNEVVAEARPTLIQRNPSLKPLQTPQLYKVYMPIPLPTTATTASDAHISHVLGT